MNDSSLKEFADVVDLFELPRWSKLRHRPQRFAWPRLLHLLTGILARPIHVQRCTFWGDRMELVLPDVVSREIFQYGFFETGLTSMLLRHLKPGMVFFDVGAHYGYFSLLASHLCGDGGQVHSFEPTPSTMEVLRRNTHGHGRIHVQQLAVYNQDGTLPLTDYGTKWGAFNTVGRGRLKENQRATVKRAVTHEVQAVSLDSYIARSGVLPDFIKVDAEGAEPWILAGMDRTLREVRPMITLEVGDVDLKKPSESRMLLESVLSRGYDAWEYHKPTRQLVPHVLQESYFYDNILLTHRRRH